MYLHSLNSHILKTILEKKVEVEREKENASRSLHPRKHKSEKGISWFTVVEPRKNRETHLERSEERGNENYVKR